MIWAIFLRQKRIPYVFYAELGIGSGISLANIHPDEARPPAVDEGIFLQYCKHMVYGKPSPYNIFKNIVW